MINPVTELRAFLTASLVSPVPRDHQESDRAFRRRRVVAAVTLVCGAVVLGWTLRITPGDDVFYVAGFLLAAIWVVGSFASGPLHLGRAHTRSGGVARPLVQSLALAALIIGLFVVGAVVAAQIPPVLHQIDDVLDHARYGSLATIFAITVVNGIAEELYFRGALYAAIGRRYPVLISTAVYALATVGTANVMLVLAAVLLGALTGLQRRVTGGILGPTITHVAWSTAMLFILPPLLEVLS
ncbi:CPBP family intramembrane metalloprotease [Luteipulveratus sp. YIM 133132]|uniref:CPBP family intramembrane metalloprotease n=1 Tax=Luteipulveratus flavus TaxID=3031728 RepID=A0ABT6C2Z6_9MICO|nr:MULTISPECIES: CPBP family intramembrane glutamic endopeptidase [unclassified Luteipulveratus]MDE9366403.1 CPBP family intramembrane metalloprotease [Luteipulveratus sp. YIM 133132]MDF8263227.1 CPBP family intramembrane metalloprotease [Luteipulveratus sp. YIM 133296]